MIRFNVSVPDELKSLLKQYSKRKGISEATVVRLALDEYLKNRNAELAVGKLLLDANQTVCWDGHEAHISNTR